MKTNKSLLAIMAAVLLLMSCLSSCSSADEEKEDGKAGSNEIANAETEPASDGAAVIPVHIQSAMDRSNQLTTGNYFIADDGSILVLSNAPYHEEYGPEYAAIPGLKKLVVSCSGFDVFALTETGDLYYHDVKISENIVDAVYAMTNVSEGGFYIAEGQCGHLRVADPKLVNSKLREENPEEYIDVNDQVVQRSAWASDAVGLAVEHEDYIHINSEGRIDVMSFMDADRYERSGCMQWTDLVLVDASKRVENGEVKSLTIAGLQSDGTVVACGDYADEILSWGPLSYLSMSDGSIVGLTTDGCLKMTGEMEEFMAEEVESWTNIAAVKVGADSKTETIICAITTDGTFYCVHCDLYNTYERSETMIFSTQSCSNLRSTLYRYCADGTVYHTEKTDEAIQWKCIEPDA